LESLHDKQKMRP